MTPAVDIVIVNWNTGGQLQACLESIAREGRRGYRLNRVVVVDNASTDASADDLRAGGLPLVVVRNAANRGFAAACNQGVAGTGCDYVLFLNPDTELFEGSLQRLVEFLEGESGSDVGLCGVGLVDADDRPATVGGRFPTAGTFAAGALGLWHLWPSRFPSLLVLLEGRRGVVEVDAVMGACLLMRTPLYTRLGGFDEAFFLYLEDVDLALRARGLGYRAVVLADVSARHVGGGASRQVPAARLYHALRSRLVYGAKHFGRAGRVLLGLATVVEVVPRLIRAALRLSGREAFATLAAYVRLAADLSPRGRRRRAAGASSSEFTHTR